MADWRRMSRLIPIGAAIIGLVGAAYLGVRHGVLLDESNRSGAEFVGYSALLASSFFGSIALLVCSVASAISGNRLLSLCVRAGMIVVAALLIASTVSAPTADEVVPQRGDASPMLSVTWPEVVLLRRDPSEQLLVVGRRDCPACAEIAPRLEELARKYDFAIYAYDTTEDREHDSAALDRRLRGMGVTEVPAILVVGKGESRRLRIDTPDLAEVEMEIKRLSSQPTP